MGGVILAKIAPREREAHDMAPSRAAGAHLAKYVFVLTGPAPKDAETKPPTYDVWRGAKKKGISHYAKVAAYDPAHKGAAGRACPYRIIFEDGTGQVWSMIPCKAVSIVKQQKKSEEIFQVDKIIA